MCERDNPEANEATQSFEDQRDELVIRFAQAELAKGNLPGVVIGGVSPDGKPVIIRASTSVPTGERWSWKEEDVTDEYTE